MDRRFKLNARMNVNILITNFWVIVARKSTKLVDFAGKQAERRLKRNLYLARLMEKENYPQTFETQLAIISKEFGHS